MCTMIAMKVPVHGGGKGQQGWFPVTQANVGFDHTTFMQNEHALLIDFVNPSMDPSARVAIELDIASGTIRARALVDNHDGGLIPGVFASVRLGSASEEPTLLVPARAVVVNQDKRFVYVVDDEGVVHQREIKILQEMEDIYVVQDGLTESEKFVLDGVRQVRDGDKVESEYEEPTEVLDELKHKAE